MSVNPDKIIIIKIGIITINATIFYTWIVMFILVLVAFLATRKLSSGIKVPRWQSFLEIVYLFLEKQIRNIMGLEPTGFIPYLGTLFIFILTCNIMEIVPLFHPPTSSLSTTAALAITVFFAVPCYGILKNGFIKHLKYYLEPTFIMLPFNIMGEFTRTLAMSVRLFGNIMSESLIVGILLLIVPLFVPIVFQIFGILIGTVQAYIFFTLSAVYIGSAVLSAEPEQSANLS